MSNPVCGLLSLELRLAENHSLKGKRMVVKSLKDRLRRRFNVSVAELEPLDDWHVAVLGVSTVSQSKTMVESTLDKVLRFVEEANLAEVADKQIDLW